MARLSFRLVAGAAMLFAALAAPAIVPAQDAGGAGGDTAAASSAPAPSESAPAGGPAADSARALAKILQDPEARQALIDRLLATADADGTPAPAEGEQAADPGAGAEAAAPAPPSGEQSVARRIAATTQGVAESVSGIVTRTLDSLSGLTRVVSGERAVNWSRLGEAARQLALVAAVTFAVYFAVQFLGRMAFGALARGAEGSGWIKRTLLLVGSSLIDALVIVASWGGGYAFALSVGEAGRMDIRQSLFLNAFLLIELIKVAMRGVLAPRYGALRLMPMGDDGARYWYFWLSRLVGLLGYGILLAVPIVNSNLGYATGQSVRVLIALIALVMAIALILRNRRTVRAALERRGTRVPADMTGRVLAALARIWHLLAILYVVALFGVWVSRPRGALSFMLGSTGWSAVAIVVGTLVMLAISRAITGGVRLPGDVKERLPLLETRLNALVPMILRVARAVVLIAVVFAIAQAWDLFDAAGWFDSPGGRDLAGRIVSAVVILLVAMGVWLAVGSWIEYRLNPNVGREPTARERTLLALFRNAFTIALIIVTLMLALSELGVNIGPLLAGAGVLGLAIGFGAQKLVQDIITGAFIQFENAMNEGDVVTVAGTSGVVEKLTIRSVALRDLQGVYHLIPFSSVDSVSNYMRGFAYHLAEIGVAYREKVPEVKRLMEEAYDRLKSGELGGDILEPLEMHGVTALADSSVVVRARIKTKPGSQWAVGRA
ncbi:MAG: mechanosensitive ion channel, partial [Azospirillaceae bacterium]